MKYYEIENLFKALVEIDNGKFQLPIKASLIINRNIDTIQKTMPPYEKTWNDTLNKYLNGKQAINPGDDGYEECKKELQILSDMDIVIDIKKINSAYIESVKLSLESARYILPMLEDGGDGNG